MASRLPLPASDEVAVLAELRRLLSPRGATKLVAHRFGISVPHLLNVKNGKRPPGEQLAAALGFRKVITFVREPEPEPAPLLELMEGGR